MTKQDHANAEAIATEIADFREGEIPKPTPAHVERWAKQFDADERSVVLSGTRRLLDKSYMPRKSAKEWLGGVFFKTEKLTGADPKKWIKKANFIRGQKRGRSQDDLLKLAEEIVQETVGIKLKDCGAPDGAYLYLDDCVFTGWTVIGDLEPWIAAYDGEPCELHVLTAGLYSGGAYWAGQKLRPAANEKGIKISFWRALEFSNKKNDGGADVEVLRPAAIPDDANVKAYYASLNESGQKLRRPGSTYPKDHLFASEAERQVLESALLKAGAKIRAAAANPKKSVRPLGFQPGFDCLGFGATFCTYRNAPNNLPLALWYGDPDTYPEDHPLGMWYPLLPRKL